MSPAALDDHPRAGICLDTCHVFAAGVPFVPETPGPRDPGDTGMPLLRKRRETA